MQYSNEILTEENDQTNKSYDENILTYQGDHSKFDTKKTSTLLEQENNPPKQIYIRAGAKQ